MDDDKSLLEKFTDTVKGIASTAADAASAALKAEEPPLKDSDVVAMPLPMAGVGLVSEPMLVPPVAAPAPRRKKRAARKTADTATKKVARKAPNKAAKKTVKKASRKAAKKTAKKTARKGTKKSAARKPNRKTKATAKRSKAVAKKRKAARRSR